MSNQNTIHQAAAQRQYSLHQSNIRGLIQQLEARLVAHEKRASTSPTNWGHAGELGYIESKLKELVSPT